MKREKFKVEFTVDKKTQPGHLSSEFKCECRYEPSVKMVHTCNGFQSSSENFSFDEVLEIKFAIEKLILEMVKIPY